MQRLFGYLRPYRRQHALGVLALAVTATLAMSIPLLMKTAIDAIGDGDGARRVGTLASVMIVVALLQGVSRTVSRALIFNAGRDVEYDIRRDIFDKLLTFPVSFYQNQRTGDLMSRLINDVQAIRLLLGPGLLNVINTPIYFVYALVIMLALDPVLTIVSIIPFPLLFFFMRGVGREIMDATISVQSGLADLSSSSQENLSGNHVVRAYALETSRGERFREENEEFQRRNLKLASARGRLMPLMRLTTAAGTLSVLGVGGYRVVAGIISLGDLVAFIGYLNLIAGPTLAMGWMIAIVQRGRAAMERLNEIFDVVPEIAEGDDPVSSDEARGDLEGDSISFSHIDDAGGEAFALKDISFRVDAGKKLAIVGRTGCGKSTLASLLPRLFDVAAGALRIDGRDVRDVPLSELRSAIAYVPQEPFLFSTTIRDNIAFSRPDASDAEVVAAATTAGVAEDIETFPEGYSTMVGERGITLSGGQKQRIALARALMAKRPILVLDDALSSVDTRTESAILDGLREQVGGVTCIVIAHRLSTIRDADEILVMDHGEIAERGEHESLLTAGGVYAALFREQQIEAEIEAF